MSLYVTINSSYIEAFKAKNVLRKDILWYVFSQLKNKKIDLQRDLHDDEVIQLLKKEIKTRQEAIDFSIRAGKTEDAETDTAKIHILEEFLPRQFSREELIELITTTSQELGISDLNKQRGQLIWALMKAHSAQIDGKLLNECISSLIS